MSRRRASACCARKPCLGRGTLQPEAVQGHPLEDFAHYAEVRRALVAWFRRQARPLPWRRTHDPYPIWVAEVMLQQTRIAAVVPYYHRFFRMFPTVGHLARARRGHVLTAWAGLGYYRRAASLHEAARRIVQDFAGRFPRRYEDARSLPGVGAYTAAAVLSIAYNLPYPVLDGNVARVLARLLALSGNLQDAGIRCEIKAQLGRLISRRSPGEFNQALMELGETVCLPRTPHCTSCPVRRWCRARREGEPRDYPLPRHRRTGEVCHLAVAVLTPATSRPGGDAAGGSWQSAGHSARGAKFALGKGLDQGLLSDVWNFPGAFGHSSAHALARLKQELGSLGSALDGRSMGGLRHGITYRKITAALYAATIPEDALSGRLRWFSVSALRRLALSGLAQKIMTVILTQRAVCSKRSTGPRWLRNNA